MLRTCRLLAGLALAALAAGCGGGDKEKTIEVTDPGPMARVQATLGNYARGQPLASEVTSYDFMVAEVRKVDPAKADVLQAGLEDLKQSKGNPAPKAKELLRKLGLEVPTGKETPKGKVQPGIR